MATPNTQGDSPEVKNIPKETKKYNIQDLLIQGVTSSLKNNSNVIDPIAYDTLQFPEVYISIRNKMKYLREATDADNTSTSDAKIEAMPDAKIIEQIEIFARSLKDARRTLYLNIKKTFSNINEKIPGFDPDMLAQKIENSDENEINSFYTNNRNLAKFIQNKF